MEKAKFNYSKDKRGWVTSNNKNKDKVKLSKYISDLATIMTRYNNRKYGFNKSYLITVYNIGGLESVTKAYIVELNDIKNLIKKNEDITLDKS